MFGQRETRQSGSLPTRRTAAFADLVAPSQIFPDFA